MCLLLHFNDDPSEWPQQRGWLGSVMKCDAQIGGVLRAKGRPVVIRALSPKGLAVILGDNSGARPSPAWLVGGWGVGIDRV